MLGVSWARSDTHPHPAVIIAFTRCLDADSLGEGGFVTMGAFMLGVEKGFNRELW